MSENNNETSDAKKTKDANETEQSAHEKSKIEQLKQKAQELWNNPKVQEVWENPKIQEIVQNKRVQEFWQNKMVRNIACAILVILLLYAGHGLYITRYYESKCQDVIAILSDVNKLSDKFNAASGDPEDGDTEDAIEELKNAAEEIASLNESLKSLTPPEGKQGERTQITSYLDKYEIMFREAHKVMAVKGMIIQKINPDEYKTVLTCVNEYWQTCQIMKDMAPIFINGENIKNVLDVEKFSKAWTGCFNKREKKDKAFYAEKEKEYKARIEESNNQLKTKNEVVFLPKLLNKTGNNIEIKGDFYNGTDKSIHDIKEVTVDIVLKRLDKTVYTIENYKVTKDDIRGNVERMHLYPKNQTQSDMWDIVSPKLIITGEGEKIKEPFDNYVVTVKDIKYSLYQK